MTQIGSSEDRNAIDHLKEEIDRLSQQQTSALWMATFGGMTADEAKEYDGRHRKIVKLMKELALRRGSRPRLPSRAPAPSTSSASSPVVH
jgi:hypothetical protein